MRIVLIASMTAVVAFVLIGSVPVASHAQSPCPCILNCPAGDGYVVVGPEGGHKTPDLNGDGVVNLQDLAIFATAWPPAGTYLFCADYDCTGFINLVDLAHFATHWLHAGPVPGYNQPGIDHYKLYDTPLGPPFSGPVWVRDQFWEVVITELWLSKFGTPVSKNDVEVCDWMAHQTWWEFFVPGSIWTIEAQDQFGTHDWILFDPRFLVLPALKNEGVGQPLPELNHYLCYEAQGPPVQIEVFLEDQFDQVQVIVLEGKYFCNPCEKESPDGTMYPVVDPWAHLTVYQVLNPIPYQLLALVQDQFMTEIEEVLLHDNRYLAVPALKTFVFPTGSSDWERIRALYGTRRPDTK
ncbi:MAG: hypothetical protein JSW50_05990 [Candidatus Latescibacterota bacterium]|nr:MAG: hypothetical protein JSW50_05990 [Candidatus Latescibacterota bacterium]